MIQIQKISKSYSAQDLFDEAELIVSSKERLGLVGRNGSGKSTLFKMILGKEVADQGEITIPKNYKLASVDQHIRFSHKSVLSEVASSLPKDFELEHFRAEKILFGLGFNQEDMDKDPASFSGGYQVRINLAKSLVQEPNMLLLDEPTNYLDIVSLRWLQRFLRSFDGEIVMITHDRDFMDSVVTHVVGISRGKLRKVKGQTAQFYQQTILEDELHEKTRANQQKKRAELERFVERFKAKASKAKQAQSRVKQLEKMDMLGELSHEENMGLRFNYADFAAKTILEAKDLSFSYDENSPVLFGGLGFHLGAKDRIAIIGKNGKGKSTLLSLIAQEQKSLTGELRAHPSAKTGYFAQTNIERLTDENSIENELMSANPKLARSRIKSICGSMMFSGDLADKKISILSGGEKSRVMLGKIIAKECNLLLLDEPTNHLDMESIEILAEEIVHFPGAVVVVTHNEMLLRAMAQRLIVFRRDGAELFDGNYDEFLEKIGWEEEGAPVKKKGGSDYKQRKKKRSKLVQERSKACSPLKKKVASLEEEIAKCEEQLGLKNELLTKEGEDFAVLSQEVGRIHIQIEELFSELEKASHEYEELKSGYDQKILELE